MFHYLAQLLIPYVDAFNVLTYHTVRAGGAAITGFLVCLLIGPGIIRRLREFKIGQVIKKDHVADLHALHKGKSGTPTMGGVLMIASTVITVLLWGTLSNRLLWVALAVVVWLGAVGFVDDLIKLKRKHNDGLSARAKFAGQILAGTLLGLYLYAYPITVSATHVRPQDVNDWPKLIQALQEGANEAGEALQAHLWEQIDPKDRVVLQAWLNEHAQGVNGNGPSAQQRNDWLKGLNGALAKRSFYSGDTWGERSLTAEGERLLAGGVEAMADRHLMRFNRLALEAAMPGVIAHSEPNLHTKVGVPGLKEVFIPLGIFYVIFVIIIIVSISNAVNLTDGLDGLAAGSSIVSIVTYAAIAYVISRADWSQYLFVTYVPEASEIFVFGAALLGTGLGFLWFNGHPAEVFMGDTGSLSLGGAIGAMAILTKQELLLPIVGGIFVLEAGSVMLQVASYKLTGKRIFRMSPLHHHFELLGWTETKVVLRFWIIAFLFAMMSLATLKLR